MRSSKSRSRSKPNRPRSLGNIVNRVFDSSGPEGKVRGTPAQLIEKYQFLARDAQLSNDRVAAENFLQHAEHYTRMLAEAMREMATEQEQRQQYHQQGGGQTGNQNGGQNGPGGGQNGNQNSQNGNQNSQSGQNQPRDRQQGQGERRDDRGDYRPEYRSDYREERPDEQPMVGGHLLIDDSNDEDAGLVETPEAAQRLPRQDEPRRNDRPSDRPNDRPRTDRPREEQRRPYPPRVDQQRTERQERAAGPVVAEPVTAPAPVHIPEAPALAEPTVATAPKPRSRSRAPKKLVEAGTDPVPGSQDKAPE